MRYAILALLALPGCAPADAPKVTPPPTWEKVVEPPVVPKKKVEPKSIVNNGPCSWECSCGCVTTGVCTCVSGDGRAFQSLPPGKTIHDLQFKVATVYVPRGQSLPPTASSNHVWQRVACNPMGCYYRQVRR